MVYDHSNYLKIMWELQIDVSIIYSFFIASILVQFTSEKGDVSVFSTDEKTYQEFRKTGVKHQRLDNDGKVIEVFSS